MEVSQSYESSLAFMKSNLSILLCILSRSPLILNPSLDFLFPFSSVILDLNS